MGELTGQRSNGVKGIVGKCIQRVIVRVREQDIPRCQLLLEFEDGTVYEFYSSSVIVPTKGLYGDNTIMAPDHGAVDEVDWGLLR